MSSSSEKHLCCSCAEEVPRTKLNYLEFRYNIPGEKEEQSAAALVCAGCFTEAHDPALFPVHEALINCNLIRVERPNKMFTPPGW